jgi:hypothetical protein
MRYINIFIFLKDLRKGVERKLVKKTLRIKIHSTQKCKELTFRKLNIMPDYQTSKKNY